MPAADVHPRVKICGIRSIADARLAVAAGADAVGVLVGQRHPSPDFVTPQEAAAILQHLPAGVTGVLVTHLEDPLTVSGLIRQCGARVVQIHGAMAEEGLRQLRSLEPHVSLVRAVHPKAGDDLEAARALVPWVDALLADSADPATGQVGGTGRVHDWSLSARLRACLPVPLILAGGLTAANVAAAIQEVRPWAVDVNSGVKAPDGSKDGQRLQAFMREVRTLPSGPGQQPPARRGLTELLR